VNISAQWLNYSYLHRDTVVDSLIRENHIFGADAKKYFFSDIFLEEFGMTGISFNFK
jgi:hypothetical protein